MDDARVSVLLRIPPALKAQLDRSAELNRRSATREAQFGLEFYLRQLSAPKIEHATVPR